MRYFILLSILFTTMLHAELKSIYGRDDRHSLRESAMIYQLQAKSVAVMVSNFYLIESYDDEYEIFSPIDLQEKQNVCRDTPYAQDYAIGSCTGFLIAANKIMTARHCISSLQQCKNSSWVFGMTRDRDFYKVDEVYHCKKIHMGSRSFWTSRSDIVIVELDRKVLGRRPLKIASSGQISKNSNVYAISSPSGLALKLSTNGKVVKNYKYMFRAFLDIFAGSSGAPVFNTKTHDLVGMVIQGGEDYTYNQFRNCFELSRNSRRGERILKLDRSFSLFDLGD